MENGQILLGKVVGTPTENCWAQTCVVGNVFAIVEVEGENAQTVGKQALTKISEVFAQHGEDNLASVKEKTAKVVQNFSPENTINIVSIVLVALKLPIAYLVILGKGKIYLQRGAILAAVLTGQDNIVGGSGYVRGGDLIILASSQFNKLVGKADLQEAVTGVLPSEAAETLSPIIHASTEASAASCIILSVGQKTATQRSVLPNINWEFVRKNSFLLAIALLVVLLLSIVLGVGRKL